MALVMSPSGEEVADETTAVRVSPPAWRKGVRVVVWLRGEHDASTADGLAERLVAAAKLGEGHVIIDLSEVQFTDLAIVRVLVWFHDLLWLQSRQVSLRAPSRFARRIIGLCGLDALLEPAPTPATSGIDPCVLMRGLG